jgi:hypothetical protein
MFKRGYQLIFCLVFFTADVFSQGLSHQVMAPAANISAGRGVNYSQTIGETAVEITGAYDRILTQGFQQPRIKMMLGTPPTGTGVKVYPNPVVYTVNIELFGSADRSFIISIININGTVVFTDEVRFSGSYWEIIEIPVSGLARGFYFVRILSNDGAINRSFKMEKM